MCRSTLRPTSVCEYIVGVLADRLGIRHAFGCPGDFAFAFDDAIESHPSMSFVLTTNELNAKAVPPCSVGRC